MNLSNCCDGKFCKRNFSIALFLIIVVHQSINSTCAFKEAPRQQQQQAPLANHVHSNESQQVELRSLSGAAKIAAPLTQTKPKQINSQLPKNMTQQTSRRLQERQHQVEQDDYRVPFWNIAHMINSVDSIESALREGANGIETDISFNKAGIPIEAYHGFPCDCGRHCHQREDFIKFVKHLAQITSPPFSSALHLVVFDLKLKELDNDQKEVAGRYLAAVLDEHLYRTYLLERNRYNNQAEPTLYQSPPLRVIISINHAVDNVLVRAFISYLREHRLDFMTRMVGFDVGMNDDLNEIQVMWNEFNGATMNIWQGDGLTNCANIIRGVERLKNAISIRNGQGHFRKVYYWTADVMYHIRTVLRLGLDAILTNQPERVVKVLNEPEFSGKYRLATAYDDPFAQFSIKPSAWGVLPPSINEAFETISNIRKTSAKFVKDLPVGISAALEKLTGPSLP